METNNIIQNNSKGYGYNYASLSDIVKQGFALPKMKTGSEDGKEYVFYKDGDEWIRGAEIVIPEGKGMNKAQLYGSALTYARRYTTLMALQLSCDDDKEVENIKADGNKKSQAQVKKQQKEISKEIKEMKLGDLIERITKVYSNDEIKKILIHYKANDLSQIKREVLEQYFDNRKDKYEIEKNQSYGDIDEDQAEGMEQAAGEIDNSEYSYFY